MPLLVHVAILLGSLVLSRIGPDRRSRLGRHLSRSAPSVFITGAGRDAGHMVLAAVTDPPAAPVGPRRSGR